MTDGPKPLSGIILPVPYLSVRVTGSLGLSSIFSRWGADMLVDPLLEMPRHGPGMAAGIGIMRHAPDDVVGRVAAVPANIDEQAREPTHHLVLGRLGELLDLSKGREGFHGYATSRRSCATSSSCRSSFLTSSHSIRWVIAKASVGPVSMPSSS